MSKTALLLHGQPRFFKECYSSIYDNIIKPNNCDVFIHFWNNKDGNNEWSNVGPSYKKNTKDIEKNIDENIENKLIKLYSPKKIISENQIDFNNTDNEEHITNEEQTFYKSNKITFFLFYSMYYSIYKVNELKKKYENENNFKYNTVIKIRFDVQINKPFIIKNIDNSFYNEKNSKAITDRIFYSSSKTMDTIASLYKNVEIQKLNIINNVTYIWKNIKYLRNEALLEWWLHKNKINVKNGYINQNDYKIYGR